jgi:hypothetical protein
MSCYAFCGTCDYLHPYVLIFHRSMLCNCKCEFNIISIYICIVLYAWCIWIHIRVSPFLCISALWDGDVKETKIQMPILSHTLVGNTHNLLNTKNKLNFTLPNMYNAKITGFSTHPSSTYNPFPYITLLP